MMDDLPSDLRNLIRFTAVARELDNLLPLQCLHVCLLVAGKPGITHTELRKHAGLSPASVSRNVAKLGSVNRKDAPGYGLVAQVPNALDDRALNLFLTAKGRDMVRRLLQAATGKPADTFSPRVVR